MRGVSGWAVEHVAGLRTADGDLLRTQRRHEEEEEHVRKAEGKITAEGKKRMGVGKCRAVESGSQMWARLDPQVGAVSVATPAPPH